MTEEERKLLEEIEAKASDAKSAADEFKRELLLERLALRLDPPTTLKLVEWIRRLEAENASLRAQVSAFGIVSSPAYEPEDVLKGARW